MAPKAGIGD